ncbi:BREX-1 system adenine-specific DNA-methyltransferase PglX [Rothia sp. (in: high G+C Gram-positive bacteria)]|uniref:BREX-1 system adenine-specific DNA-methyltransferase PglX n=1 Tax=Rothia sp. (in: high G+C Gram-positive bacteria) TaxID=1885016 RepID=UPI0032180132
MNTTLLKSFATSSRTELIREVAARITAVLAQGSPERVEQPRAVTQLERAISSGGGGDKGKAHVADKVAYTWFNRIIALRFMDANGYTGVGIVSPAADQVGQPEILAAAKRGQLDGDVVKCTNAATVTGLLNGTRQPRPGVHPQAEAYSLLLADYCRYWNRAMPFMFEREGDFTELLIPANVLAEDSVLSRSVTVLTEEVCQDVEVIGWLYQFYISERKDEVFAGFKKNKKAGADEIPAATQLFTPHWIVRYLVENSVGRLWMLNHPESRLVDQMDYYIAPVDEETDFLKITNPEELTVIDPACGSGHMLTYAFDLLYAIYEEEGYTPSQIPGLILTNNLYGTEIDPRAGALAAFALTMKAAARRKLFLKNPVKPNICVLEPISFSADELSYLVTEDGDRNEEESFWNQFAEVDTLGSLVLSDPRLTTRLTNHLTTLDGDGDIFRTDALNRAQRVIQHAKLLSSRYAVVVANPPYMGSKQMGARLRAFVEREFNKAKNDLATAFIEAGLRLRTTGGLVAMVCPQSWMFLSRYEAFRADVTTTAPPVALAHLGPHAFPELAGEVVQVAAFVLASPREDGRPLAGTYLRLVDLPDAASKELELRAITSGIKHRRRIDRTLEHIGAIPGAPLAYWASEEILDAFEDGTAVGTIAPTRKGMVTARNNEFLRLWYEVSADESSLGRVYSRASAKESGKRWFGYIKGGPARRWYGNYSYVVDWFDDGRRLQTERHPTEDRVWATNFNLDFIFRPNINWGDISGAGLTARWADGGMLFDGKGPACFPPEDRSLEILALLNSHVAAEVMNLLNPTLNFLVGDVARIPLVDVDRPVVSALAKEAVDITRADWDGHETSWDFRGSPLTRNPEGQRLDAIVEQYLSNREVSRVRLSAIERELERAFGEAYGVQPPADDRRRVETVEREDEAQVVTDLVSYFVGCSFGRYSLDAPGLILADQSATLQVYLVKVPSPTFEPDADNVIPIVDGDWFEDDIVERFRHFLRAAFGEQHFEENLQFVTESLGVKHLRDYFVKSFYKDHVKRYKKRPIYWLFSSPKGSFNALIYMHRYTPSTVSTVLTYLREYVTKLESALQQAERVGNAKEADRLRKILVELNEYEHDTLFPKASENVVIELDDGVKVNYPKFGAALKKIPGLEAVSD